jgi:hypothetical protein
MDSMAAAGVLFLLVLLPALGLGADPSGGAGPGGAPGRPTGSAVRLQTLEAYSTARPFTRWWWFASIIEESDVRHQLDWLKANGFGGVEIAFIYPVGRDPDAERIEWLSPEWTRIVAFTKRYADRIGLGCDFTFGTLWPFGGTFVEDRDRGKVFGDPDFRQPLRLSWTHPDTGSVIDHLSAGALRRYALVMGKALGPAIRGSPSALFCDSWEVETRRIWTDGFGEEFTRRFGYDITPYMDHIYDEVASDARYDYMKLVSDYVIADFYQAFTEECHRLGAISRVQCAGSPTDLIRAYASVDVPETEAMLYEPAFARIVASAAALADKPIVSSETFTCIYGFPDAYQRREQISDLKLVADALFANGVNQIVWHGKPFNPEGSDSVLFYATVHVGPSGSLAADLAEFNQYLTGVSSYMRRGRPYSDIALYLPLEDAWIAGEYPEELRMKWSWGAYELRYVYMPDHLRGYHPLWIDHEFLKSGEVMGGSLHCGDIRFSALYVDVGHLDSEALDTILDLALKGLPVCMPADPRQPGLVKSGTYAARLRRLKGLENVSSTGLTEVHEHPPLIEGDALPAFWCRREGDACYIFLAHPAARGLKYPLTYGQALPNETVSLPVKINLDGRAIPTELRFEPGQSILLKVDVGGVTEIDIAYRPTSPGVE